MSLEIALLILVCVLIVLIILYIPVHMRIWRVAKNMEITLQTLNQNFPAILKNIEEITANVNSSTAVINQKIQNIANAANRPSLLVGEILNNIQYLTSIALRLPIFRIIGNVIAVAKGIRVFTDVLLKKEKT